MADENVRNAGRDNFKDIPEKTSIDVEKEDSEDLKKLGRQVEV